MEDAHVLQQEPCIPLLLPAPSFPLLQALGSSSDVKGWVSATHVGAWSDFSAPIFSPVPTILGIWEVKQQVGDPPLK